MKLLNLLSISFAVTAFYSNKASAADVVKKETATTFMLSENFRTSKNIMFSSLFGGTSHVNWVLTILEELSNRGHATFFLTKDDQIHFTKNYPYINTSSVGPGLDEGIKRDMMEKIHSKNRFDSGRVLAKAFLDGFKDEYLGTRNFIVSNNIDLAICDQLCTACVEASLSLNIPFIITGTFLIGEDAKAPFVNNDFLTMKNPTTKNMSLRERLYDMFIDPVEHIIGYRDIIWSTHQTYKSLGLSPSKYMDEKWKDSLKLINTAFGFEVARPLSSLMEVVGPIIPRKYSTLDIQSASFLDSRSKVAYVAFGQHVVSTMSEKRLLLTALLESMETKYIDGIIWATPDDLNKFPEYVTTSSNTTYNTDSFKDPSSNVMFMKWAPQMAILQHPSTSFFLTHGGASSIYEAMFCGKRIAAFPYFTDQPGAASNAESNGIGLKLERSASQETANKIIQSIAKDEDGTFQSNVNRYKALIQIRSKHGSLRGADLVEEVLFTQKEGGKLPHRYYASREMSFMKANNYDIYLFLIFSAVCLGHMVLSFFTATPLLFKSKNL